MNPGRMEQPSSHGQSFRQRFPRSIKHYSLRETQNKKTRYPHLTTPELQKASDHHLLATPLLPFPKCAFSRRESNTAPRKQRRQSQKSTESRAPSDECELAAGNAATSHQTLKKQKNGARSSDTTVTPQSYRYHRS